MTLFQATLFAGLFLIAFGAYFLRNGMASAGCVQAFPRSKRAAYLLLGLAATWFLYEITQLGAADFGQYKNLLFIAFLTITVGSFIYVPDFLAVRGLASLILLSAGVFLDSAFMQAPPTRLFLVSGVYAAIILALVLGGSPYRLRDFLEWLYKKELRPRIFGSLFVAYGVLLTVVAFTY